MVDCCLTIHIASRIFRSTMYGYSDMANALQEIDVDENCHVDTYQCALVNYIQTYYIPKDHLINEYILFQKYGMTWRKLDFIAEDLLTLNLKFISWFPLIDVLIVNAQAQKTSELTTQK